MHKMKQKYEKDMEKLLEHQNKLEKAIKKKDD